MLYSHDALKLTPGESLAAIAIGLPAALLGAVAPDIDLASSIVHRRLRLALLAIVTLLSLVALRSPAAQAAIERAFNHAGDPAAAPYLATGLLALLTGLAAVALLALLLPRHRGPTHTWRFGLLSALALTLVTQHGLSSLGVDPRTTLLVAATGFGYYLAGFASHLYGDGLLRIRSPHRA